MDPLYAEIQSLLIDDKFETALTTLAALRAPVDAFFDNVTVNCEDAELRVNRLHLLTEISHCIDLVADFSKIEG